MVESDCRLGDFVRKIGELPMAEHLWLREAVIDTEENKAGWDKDDLCTLLD